MGWYDRAEIYDVWMGWDPARERDFVLGASERYGIARPRRMLEPFCGSGRLLRAVPGAIGLDLNPHMLRFAASRGARVFRAGAARFATRAGAFDLAFNLIDSFRHLLTEEHARAHLRAVARALREEAVYVLGLDVTGDLPGGDGAVEAWGIERDGLRVDGTVRALGDADLDTRVETVHVRAEAERDGTRETVEDFVPMRTYSRRELEDLIDDEGSFEIAAVFDRGYDLDRPVEFSEISGSAVLALKKCRE